MQYEVAQPPNLLRALFLHEPAINITLCSPSFLVISSPISPSVASHIVLTAKQSYILVSTYIMITAHMDLSDMGAADYSESDKQQPCCGEGRQARR